MDREAASVGWAAVIVNHNGSVFLDPCLRSITGMDRPPARIVVVDNDSDDDSLVELNAWPQVEVETSPVNLGYSGGANLGVSRAAEPIVLVLNPDVTLGREFGGALLRIFESDERLGAAGAKLRYPGSSTLQHAGGVVNWPSLTTAHRFEGEADIGQADAPADVDYVTGAVIALRRTAFDAVGGFDEMFYPAYFEDVDLCFRLRAAGWRVRYEPGLSGEHHEGGSTGRSLAFYRLWHRNRIRFALAHMNSQQWWSEFVPAEMKRLRGELSAVSDDDWVVRSGAAEWETLARAGSLPDGLFDTALHGRPLRDAVAEIGSLVAPVDLPLEPIDYRATFGERARHWAMSWRVWRWLDRAMWRQRRFNDAVIRALHAQDRMNRELSAQILLTLILNARDDSEERPIPDER